MRTRKLGKNGPDLTVIGLGAWAMGGAWEFGWGAVNDQESVKTIHRALDLGINWIDTAAVYGLGHSEEVVGRALRGTRDKVFLATKCGMVWDERGTVTKSLRPDSIRREMENSLRRLNTDHVDLYQFHWPDPDTPVEDSWNVMVQLQNEGKTRFIGVSNFSVQEMDRCRPVGPIQSLQPPYNMLRPDAESDVLPYCGQHGIGVVAYSPMASGLLTGHFDFDSLAPDDWRRKSPRFNEENRTDVLHLLEKLKLIADRLGTTVSELAVAWVLRNENVTSAIVGARKTWQIEETVGAGDLDVPTTDWKTIETILRSL